MNRLPIRTSTLAMVISAAMAASAAFADSHTPFDEDLGESRLEQTTPAGQISPGWTPPSAVSDPGEQRYITEPTRDINAEASQAITSAFSSAYRAAGSPRMAVYFNRELSEEVREWIPGYQQLRVTSNQTASVTGPNLQTADASYSSDRTATLTTRQYVDASGRRVDPSEEWTWQFEDAITQVFLSAGANVVDRAMMFRQAAHKNPNSQGADGSISITQNEMSALNGFADILVEVKVTRSASALGYDFRATGKNIKTGQIIASAYLNGEGDQREQRYVATANGYEKQYTTPLTVDYISRELALKLMQSMAPQLSR